MKKLVNSGLASLWDRAGMWRNFPFSKIPEKQYAAENYKKNYFKKKVAGFPSGVLAAYLTVDADPKNRTTM